MNKRQYILILLSILYISCDKQSNPFQQGSSNNYQFDIDMGGKARDFIIQKNVNAENFSSNGIMGENDIMIPCINEIDSENCNDRFWCAWNENVCEAEYKDLLFVANELDGLLIYEIKSGLQLEFDLIYSNNGFEYTDDPLENILDLELRSIYYSDSNHTIYVLDKFEFIYQIFLPLILIDDENKQFCVEQEPIHSLVVGSLGTYHATKLLLDDTDEFVNGIFIVNKHNANNELYLEDSYSEIQYESYESFFQPSGTSCEGNGAPLTTTNSLLSQDDSLSYNITDISYFNDVFVLANPTDEYYSYKTYNFQSDQFDLINETETMSPGKILSTLLVGDNLYTGVKGAGCYITLLPGDGILDENDNILHVPENFSVYDINYEKFNGHEFLLLSCGSNGVLVYHDENEDGLLLEEDFKGHIISSYAYVAKMYDKDTVFVGTRNGVEIYNIGE